MSTLLERFAAQAQILGRKQDVRRARVVSSWSVPSAIEELAEMEATGRGLFGKSWVTGSRSIDGPTAGLGFAGAPLPNTAPVNAPSAVTGVTAETNLYTPATTSNADWALIPQGAIRCPQVWLVQATGIITSSSSGQTCAFTQRIGTSSTPSSNVTLGATGAVALGSTITNALWQFDGQMTIRSVGTAGTAISTAAVTVSQQAAGSSTSSNAALAGGTGSSGSIDWTQQQGFVISVTPSASGVSVTLEQFVLIAID